MGLIKNIGRKIDSILGMEGKKAEYVWVGQGKDPFRK
jgi:hypothetical protein